MRGLLETFFFVLAVAAVMAIARGFPMFGKILFHPFVLLVLAALFVLGFVWRSRRTSPSSKSPK